MSFESVERIANTILYEGYLLYPYRRSALKNQRRWHFGLVYPPGREQDNEPSSIQAECLVLTGEDGEVHVRVRFLHLHLHREGTDERHEAVERSVHPPPLGLRQLSIQPLAFGFQFGGGNPGQQEISGELAASAEQLSARLFRLTLRIRNTKREDRTGPGERMPSSFASTHAILSLKDGRFISLLDPPENYRDAARACRNIGLWPVLAGDPESAATMLASPIILYDYPDIAPESAGDLFDGTEIDELLNLRILTLSDREKQEIRDGDPRGRAVLERTEGLTDDELRRLHGVMYEERNGSEG